MQLSIKKIRSLLKEEVTEQPDVDNQVSLILDAEISDKTRGQLEHAFESSQYSTHILYVLRDWLNENGDSSGAQIIGSILESFTQNEAKNI